MSPRLKIIRKVLNPPIIKGFKPYGGDNEKIKSEPINLLYEEYEALRLCDYDDYNHHQASVIMGISRPTYTRIYAQARQKIAKAFVEGRQIIIEGGKVYFDSDWYTCNNCNCFFNNPEKDKKIEQCPLCKSEKINSFEAFQYTFQNETKRCYDICVCPTCDYEQPHPLGIPCNTITCPKCGSFLVRYGTPHYKRIKKQI